jgi:nucleotidyltransferase/DNA polymerase involved in DNA repair
MQALIRQARAYSPLIEPGESDGHLFMDVTGTGRLFGPPVDVAWRLRRQATSDLHLAPIWAVAPNKLVAKVATRLVKPNGEYIVGAGEEEAFLAPQPLGLVPGIERHDLIRLRDFNFTRAGQVAGLSLEELQIPFGRRAGYLYETVRGIDASPVSPLGERPPRIVRHHTFADDAHTPASLESALYRLVEQAGRRLRDRRLAARAPPHSQRPGSVHPRPRRPLSGLAAPGADSASGPDLRPPDLSASPAASFPGRPKHPAPQHPAGGSHGRHPRPFWNGGHQDRPHADHRVWPSASRGV